MSYANSVDLTLYKLEEFHPHGYLVFQPSILFCSYMLHIKQPANHKCSATNIVQDECTEKSIRIIGEIYYCPVHYPKFCRIVYPQYRYQYLCTASLNSPTNLLSNAFSTCLNSIAYYKQVSDTINIWLCIADLHVYHQINKYAVSMLVGIVGNAYIDLTKEERQYISTAMTPQDIDVIETKKLYSRIHSHRKMHRLLTTLWPSNKCVRNHAVFGCRFNFVIGLRS
ncbi:conserved hypothetical protein [Trichinella spiralis]|uniref:hypothetical protein n=1 Tax=Trichinella spiralis TaxID=6334 RepID=UPI0001EFCAFB|nr:conserved hypothetical protein [Trichinella spiralis]